MTVLVLCVAVATSRTIHHYENVRSEHDSPRDLISSQTCVTDVTGLISAFQSLSSGTNRHTINVCAETIVFSDETGDAKSSDISSSLEMKRSNTYDFRCTLPFPQRCLLDGREARRFFYGINVVATFQGIDFVNGSSLKDSVYDHTSGGALYFTKSIVTLIDCRFFGNKADWGGAIFMQKSVLNLKGPNLFQSNEAKMSGGAICLQDSSSVFGTRAPTEFRENKATYASAIKCSGNSLVNLKRSAFFDNESTDVRYNSA